MGWYSHKAHNPHCCSDPIAAGASAISQASAGSQTPQKNFSKTPRETTRARHLLLFTSLPILFSSPNLTRGAKRAHFRIPHRAGKRRRRRGNESRRLKNIAPLAPSSSSPISIPLPSRGGDWFFPPDPSSASLRHLRSKQVIDRSISSRSSSSSLSAATGQALEWRSSGLLGWFLSLDCFELGFRYGLVFFFLSKGPKRSPFPLIEMPDYKTMVLYLPWAIEL